MSEYYKFKQLEAIDNILNKDDIYFQRKLYRWFSTTYNTPLLEVYELDWDFVLTHYYEANLEKLGYNEVLSLAKDDYLTEFMEENDEEAQKFVESLLGEQEETIKKKENKDNPKEISFNFEDEDLE